jgi:predicted RNase H-like HicB family nuclease
MTTSIERKPLEYYLDLKYPVTLEAAPEGGYFIEIEDLPGCYSQGETVEEAVEMIEEARRLWIEVAYEDSQDIPLPKGNREYSGKFFIRTPKSLHRALTQMADREGVSLNQFLVATLSRAVGAKESRANQEKKRSSNGA